MTRYVWLAIVLTAPVVRAQSLPAGPGADVLEAKCVGCHESDIVVQQRLSLTGWTRSVDKMVRWGASVTADERAVLQPYLAEHFGPRPAASHVAADAGLPTVASAQVGAATYKRACMTCHDADIIEQQRLTRGRWVGSVDKMIRWGATVSAAEKDPLVDYLASRFGPR